MCYMISFLQQSFFWKYGLNKVSLEVVNKISFDKRSAFLFEEGEEGNDDEGSNEVGIKYMIFREDWNTFLEAFFLKIVSILIYLF